ncbi:MAG TPA: hypothetical protein VH583_18100 [Vicinamibacterales bacterium]|jgi:hypothetical protein
MTGFIAAALSASLLAPMQPGPNAVGFKMVVEVDATRPALPPGTGDGRPIPIAIWYPAVKPSGTPMRLRDYIVAGDTARIGVPNADAGAPVAAFISDAQQRGVAASDLAALVETPVLARSDARPAAGRFPLVLFAHASVETESVTAEYLASYGYVVAGVRSRGAADVEYRLNRANLVAVTADLDVAATRMKREPDVRGGAIAVIGMSNGAIAAVALQLERQDIGAIVSLDGTIGENAGGVYLTERSGGDVGRFSAPILHLYTPDNDFLNLDYLRGFNASPRVLVAIPELRHRDFLAYAAFDHAVPQFSGAPFSERVQAGFVWVNRYALHFIDASLRGSRHGAAFLRTDPSAQGVPSGLMEIERPR